MTSEKCQRRIEFSIQIYKSGDLVVHEGYTYTVSHVILKKSGRLEVRLEGIDAPVPSADIKVAPTNFRHDVRLDQVHCLPQKLGSTEWLKVLTQAGQLRKE